MENGWKVWVWLLGVVVRTPLVSVRFCSSIYPYFLIFKMFFVLVPVFFCKLNFMY